MDAPTGTFADFLIFCLWFFPLMAAISFGVIVWCGVQFCRLNGYEVGPYMRRGEVVQVVWPMVLGIVALARWAEEVQRERVAELRPFTVLRGGRA